MPSRNSPFSRCAQFIGTLAKEKRFPGRHAPDAGVPPSLAIQTHGCAFRRDGGMPETGGSGAHGSYEPPAGVLALPIQNIVLYLKGNLGIAIGTSLLSSVLDPPPGSDQRSVSRLREMRNSLQRSPWLAGSRRAQFKSFVHHRTLSTASFLLKEEKCNLWSGTIFTYVRVAHIEEAMVVVVLDPSSATSRRITVLRHPLSIYRPRNWSSG